MGAVLVAGGEHKERLTSQATDFAKTFREEMKKGMDELNFSSANSASLVFAISMSPWCQE